MTAPEPRGKPAVLRFSKDKITSKVFFNGKCPRRAPHKHRLKLASRFQSAGEIEQQMAQVTPKGTS